MTPTDRKRLVNLDRHVNGLSELILELISNLFVLLAVVYQRSCFPVIYVIMRHRLQIEKMYLNVRVCASESAKSRVALTFAMRCEKNKESRDQD